MANLTMKSPETLQEAIVYFSDPQRAFDYACKLRWPDGKVTCPRCGGAKHSFIKTRRIWFCYDCNKQFTLKIGTVFEDSPIGLDKWMAAFWMLVNCKNGVSSMEIHRALGVTQKTAWFMLQRLRLALQENSKIKLGGHGFEVEVDETFIGGKARYMHKNVRERKITSRGGDDKAVVFGLLERGGKVHVYHVPDRQHNTVAPLIKTSAIAGTAIFSDAWSGYNGLRECDESFQHEVVDHAVEYVRDRVHTNGLENFWSLVKRGLHGTYISVEPFHLFRYLDEQSFRFNNRATKERHITDRNRFELGMSQILNKRLTYEQLIGHRAEQP